METTPEKQASGNCICVASCSTTVTLVPHKRRDNALARRGSTSRAVSLATRTRNKSVASPGPGPISRASSPMDASCRIQGIMSRSSFRFQIAELQMMR